MRLFRRLSSLVFLAFLLVSGLSAAPKADWTLLVYMAANNDLEPDALDNLDELLGSESSRATILVQVDRGMNYSSEGAGGVAAWSGAKRFAVENGRLAEKADLGDIDSTDPKELASFVRWGLEEHPAKHYALVLWDHGGGWTGYASSDANPDGNLDPASIRQALSSALKSAGLPRLDLLGFDACLMANYETALVLRPLASYLVASEETEPGHGWDYGAFKAVFDSDGDGVALGKAILAGFRQKSKEAGDESEITLSLVDLGALPALEASVSSFSDGAVGSIAEVAPLLGRSANKVLRFGKSPQPDQDLHLVDLGAFASRVASEDPALKASAEALRAALAKATLDEVTGSANKGATGLSAYFPDRKSSYDEGYDAIAPASWKKLITGYFSGGAAISKAQADSGGFGFAEAAAVEKGPDGWTVRAPLLEGSSKTAIEYDLTFGRREGDRVIFMGSQSAEVSEDGKEVSGLWDGKRFVISQDGVEAEAYAEFGSEDGGSNYLDIPFAYYASGRTKGAYQYLLLEISFDDKGEVTKEKWLLESANQTYGEFKPKKGSRVQPIVEVFVDGKDGSTFEPTTKAALDPNGDIGWDWKDWNKTEKVYFQLEIYDTGDGFDTAEAEMDLAK